METNELLANSRGVSRYSGRVSGRFVAATVGLLLVTASSVPGLDARAESPGETPERAAAATPAEPEAGDEIVAETPGPPVSDLVFARLAENPVAGILRIPVAAVGSFGLPPKDRVGFGLILAPIIPVRFKGSWKILTRITIPAVATVPFGRGQDPMRPVDVDGRTTGFGDMGFEIVGAKQFRGKKGQFFDVGLGPFIGAPSASDDFLGRGRWLLGPEIALGITVQRWVTVLLARNEWSVGKAGNRADVNQLWMQYFLFYNLPKLFYLVYEPVITVNWERAPGDRATLPVGIGFGRHIRLPKRPRLGLTTRCSGLYNALRTDQGAKWQVVATLVFFNPNPLVFGAE